MEMIKPSVKAWVKPEITYFGVARVEQSAESCASISAQFNQLTASEKSFLDSQAG